MELNWRQRHKSTQLYTPDFWQKKEAEIHTEKKKKDFENGAGETRQLYADDFK